MLARVTLLQEVLAVRLVVYNIRYATGSGARFHLPVPGAGYLRNDRRILQGLTAFLQQQNPDIVGLLEVDTGSLRSRRVNQAQHLADALGHYSTYQCKYGAGSFNHHLPVLRKQSNAFLAAPRVHGERFHYFESGIKRLVIELELDEVCLFLVHLSLKYRHRQFQLRHLHDLVMQAPKPVIVAGDFNTFWGTHELFLFQQATKLRSANAGGLLTFPSDSPQHELDFILVSPQIDVTGFSVPDIRLSDHRPLVCDFVVNCKEPAHD
jgi:endonuclease/exonuclease/phosphatase family metal-dependent hydrolase